MGCLVFWLFQGLAITRGKKDSAGRRCGKRATSVRVSGRTPPSAKAPKNPVRPENPSPTESADSTATKK